MILRLGHSGRIERVDIDTAYYKGNYPHQVSIQGALLIPDQDAELRDQCQAWPMLLDLQYLRADSEHHFGSELRQLGPISHVRVNIHPDGGLSRVRMYGQPNRG